MACEKLEEQIPKLIPAILSLYKKNNEHYIISKVGTVWAERCEVHDGLCKQTGNTNYKLSCLGQSTGWVLQVISLFLFFTFFSLSSAQSLCQVLDASVNRGSRVLETQLDSLLIALHQQVHIMDTQTINTLINELVWIVDVPAWPK